MHIKSIAHISMYTYILPKDLIPWRDSNPCLLFLFLERMRCPLRHAAIGQVMPSLLRSNYNY
jgi:hypothetical protein